MLHPAPRAHDRDMFGVVENMLVNFAYQIQKFSFIPNGNRIYYLSRSQPPLF